MAQYLPTVDLWDPAIDAALRNGQLRLQSGQWVRCGSSHILSRFDRASKHHIRCFHGENSGQAGRKYLECKLLDRELAARRTR